MEETVAEEVMVEEVVAAAKPRFIINGGLRLC
jgi:hypothetical protein